MHSGRAVGENDEMSNSPWSRPDRRRQLLAAWERRCRAKGDADHCTGADALFLVTTLTNAIRQASATPELGRAARTWGAGFAAPVEALAALTHLRDALLDQGTSPAVAVDVVNGVFDQVMMEAVDAASTNLRSVALKDPLTGCANRRALDEELGHAVVSARRSGLDLTVAIVDLDGLKAINDNHGHAAGDAALVALVGVLRDVLREADALYRTGGDEFVVVAPFTEPAGARALMRRAERMGGPAFSWGIASLGQLPPDLTADMVAPALLASADNELYHRRRTRREVQRRAERRRRMATAASVAASAAVVVSGAGLAAALTVGSSPETGPATGTTLGSPGPAPTAAPGSAAPAFHPLGGEKPAPVTSPDALGPLEPGGAAPGPASAVSVLSQLGALGSAGPPLGTAVVLSASAIPAVVGHDVDYDAYVTPAEENGSVEFLDDGTPMPGCGAVAVASGHAQCTVRYDAAGSHAITAVFAPGSSTVLASASAALLQSVTEPTPGSGGDGVSSGAGNGHDGASHSRPDHGSRSPRDTDDRQGGRGGAGEDAA
jgi:diguanylate cyclase (GGDEF)-like protein